MATAEELYRQACNLVGGTPSPEFDLDTRRIWLLIGALSEAFWRRRSEPGFSPYDAMLRNTERYTPESGDELTLWAELTAPDNFPAVVRYVAQCGGQVNDYAASIHARLLEDAKSRWETEAQALPAEPHAAADRGLISE